MARVDHSHPLSLRRVDVQAVTETVSFEFSKERQQGGALEDRRADEGSAVAHYEDVEARGESSQLRLGLGIARSRCPEDGSNREALVGKVGDLLQPGDVRLTDIVPPHGFVARQPDLVTLSRGARRVVHLIATEPSSRKGVSGRGRRNAAGAGRGRRR